MWPLSNKKGGTELEKWQTNLYLFPLCLQGFELIKDVLFPSRVYLRELNVLRQHIESLEFKVTHMQEFFNEQYQVIFHLSVLYPALACNTTYFHLLGIVNPQWQNCPENVSNSMKISTTLINKFSELSFIVNISKLWVVRD